MTATRRPWLGDLLPELALAAAGFAGYLLVRWATLDRTPDAVANARGKARHGKHDLDRAFAFGRARTPASPLVDNAGQRR